MNKQVKPIKLLPVWLAVSAVVIIAGVILMALLGFNTAADRAEQSRFEVRYGVTIVADTAKEEKLKAICEEAFTENGISYCDFQKADGMDRDEDTSVLIYTFTGEVSEEVQAAVKSAFDQKRNEDEGLKYILRIYGDWHTENLTSDYDGAWRGAIAVGVVVALVYAAFRFGIGCALTGLVLSLHDALFVLSVLAIARIPVYGSSILLYAALAALLSLILWLVQCMKLRDAVKNAQNPLSAEDAVTEGYLGAWKLILISAAVFAGVLLLFGLVATAGVRVIVLPMLLCVAASLYSSLLLGPSLHVHVKRVFDKASRKGKKKYVGKQKQTEE